jgi:hypothetical protein
LLTVVLFGCFASASVGHPSGAPGPTFAVPSGPLTPAKFASAAQVVAAVEAGLRQKTMASNVEPGMKWLAARQEYGNNEAVGCQGARTYVSALSVGSCSFGDVSSSKVMVLEGDSRAQMWFDTIKMIATETHYKLVFLAKPGCPSAIGSFRLNDGRVETAPWPACTAWHNFVIQTIKTLAPRVVITASQLDLYLTGLTAPASVPTTKADFAAFYRRIPSSAKLVVLGDFSEPVALNPTLCLSTSPSNIQTCTWTIPPDIAAGNAAVRAAARAAHALFIDEKPWLCAGSKCPPVINNVIPYTIDGYHLDRVYAKYLTGVLWTALAPVLKQ